MRHHLSTSIDGLLSLSDYSLKKMLPNIKEDGKPVKTVSQLKKGLLALKSEGHRFIPAEGCDNFDPVKGCLGHETDAQGEAEPWQKQSPSPSR